jgi:hypothetical protein
MRAQSRIVIDAVGGHLAVTVHYEMGRNVVGSDHAGDPAVVVARDEGEVAG